MSTELDKLTALTLEKNIPLTATIELTRRCPCRCAHCYLPETQGRKKIAAGKELGAAEWNGVFKQLAESGCLFLVFTGGEPLLRPDFAKICAHAGALNFAIRVFTTGFGLTDGLLRKLAETNVSSFELSLYGRKEIHDAITRRPGSFETALSAAKKLKAGGFKVKLKMPLMKSNCGQTGYLMRLCARHGFRYGFDPVIAPANDGLKETLKLRPSAASLERIFRDPRLNGPMMAQLKAGAVYEDFFCGAGKSAFSVDPYGGLYPCLQIPVPLGNLKKTPFLRLWKNSPWLKKWRGSKLSDLKQCAACRYASVCSRCPGISLLEEDDIMAPNKSACRFAKISHSFARQGRAIKG
ncbi:MAG: radical SAM protein [Elusimicrobia bacterium]|nr:radical SAM protein [Elusimicrobiota bacterium]